MTRVNGSIKPELLLDKHLQAINICKQNIEKLFEFQMPYTN